MALRADDLIDRRRLRRKLTFWRVAAILLAAAAIVVGTALLMDGRFGIAADHIAKVRIEGTITEDEDLIETLEEIGESARVQGVILAINSPGGTTAGGEAIFEAVRRLAERKPVVAQVGTLAASAGYMIASAADHIVARQSSIVGSIGVLVQLPNVMGLLDKLGVQVETVKSAPLKAEPSPFNPTTEEERAMLRAMILDSYDWFIDLVDERRPLDRAGVVALADGSVFTGRQALARKLVDQLGGEQEAIGWLAGKGVNGDLEVIEWKPEYDRSLFFSEALARAAANYLGVAGNGVEFLRQIGAERLFLDGLLSVWHADKSVWRN